MEIYKISLVYKDKHVEVVEVLVEQVGQFLDCMLHRKPWWDGEKDEWGFFTDIESIRYMTLHREEKVEVVEDKSQEPEEPKLEVIKE